MALSDAACKNAHKHPKTSNNKPFKLSDEKGLYLLVKPQADGWGKWWRFKYRFGGNEKLLSLGTYPDTSLQQAREKRDAARKQLAEGIDPGEHRKASKIAQAHTFEHVARDWLASIEHTVRDITHQKKIKRFERHVFPVLGGMGISDIKSPEIYNLIKPLINRLETAHRVHSEISAVFSYAIAHGFTDYDPAQAVAAQIPAQKVKHRAALTEPKDVAQLAKGHMQLSGNLCRAMRFQIVTLALSTARRNKANGMEGHRPKRQRMALLCHQNRSIAYRSPINSSGRHPGRD